MKKHFPAEWQNQAAIVLNFPHSNTDWQQNLAAVEQVFINMAKIISTEQILVLLFESSELQTRILAKFSAQQRQNIKAYIVASNDTWARDFFAISIYEDDKPVMLDFTFNAWDNKFAATKDDQINQNLANQHAFKAELKKINMVLEGGAIETDGAGTLLTSHFSKIHMQRNPNLTEQQIRNILRDSLGIDRILSLETAQLEGDDTDGHIDTLARFINKDTIVYCACNDKQDKHFLPLQNMRKELEQFTTAEGRPYNLVPIPMPKAIYNAKGARLAASYVNFIILKNSVILPVYGDNSADQYAIDTLSKAMPGYTIHAVNAREIIEQGGSLHCLSMQIPLGFLN